MDPLLRYAEPRHYFGRRIVGDHVEIQVRGHPDGMRHIVRQHHGGERLAV
jgi:hypothetical protein